MGEREITWYHGLWHQKSSFKTTKCLFYHVSLCWPFWSHHLCFIASRPWSHFSFKLSSWCAWVLNTQYLQAKAKLNVGLEVLCWFKEKNTKTFHFVLALKDPLFCCASDVPRRHFIHNTYLTLLLRFCMCLNCSTRSQTPQVLGLCLTEWKPWI